jgi:hypothetical protein
MTRSVVKKWAALALLCLLSIQHSDCIDTKAQNPGCQFKSQTICDTPTPLGLQSSGTTRSVVKKRAALALLRLLRKTPPENPVVAAESFSLVLNSLLDERDLGLLLSATTLLQGICARNGPSECFVLYFT